MTEITQGQIWREVDPRLKRFIRIVAVGTHTVMIETVIKDGADWIKKPRTGQTHAQFSRFNGKRGGYEYVETRL